MTEYNKFGRLCDGSKPLSNDTRRLIITDIEEQGGNPETGTYPRGLLTRVGEKYRLGHSTISRIWKHFVDMKTVSPLKCGRRVGSNRKLNQEDESFIAQTLTVHPTMYQYELKEKILQYTNNPDLNDVSIPTICRTIKNRLPGGEWSRKKVKSSNKNRYTPENMDLTQIYLDFISRQDKYTIKFMDEAGVNTNNGRRFFGYSPKREVAVDISKHAKGANHTVNLLVGLDGTKFCTVLNGPSDTFSYINFFNEAMQGITDQGRPVLNPGDIIVVDNCPFHHSEAEDILINFFDDYNISYIFLPRYSPDMNPVEACFLKMKTLLKQEYYQRLLADNLVAVAVLDTISDISLSDIHGFYRGVTDNYMNVD